MKRDEIVRLIELALSDFEREFATKSGEYVFIKFKARRVLEKYIYLVIKSLKECDLARR